MRKIKLQRVIIIALVMAVIGGLQSLYDHAILISLFSLGPSDLYQFQTDLVFNIASGFGGGLIAGLTLILIDDRFRTKPYYQSLLILIATFMSVWAVRNTDKEESKYLRKFGVKPHFKAGAHYGSVIAGEIGVIKRDITYSGDVLNTTARIQGMRNELETSFLMSKSLFELAGSDASRWNFERKGKIPLKGKKDAMDLLSVELRVGFTTQT